MFFKYFQATVQSTAVWYLFADVSSGGISGIPVNGPT